MPGGDLEVRRNLVIPARELVETASRSSGPGGQHVNKTSTRVTLRWNVETSSALSATQRVRLRQRLASRLSRDGTLAVHAGASRSRAQNRDAARRRLAALVSDALRVTRRRVATRPGRGARETRLAEKKHRGLAKRRRQRPEPGD